MKVERQQTYKSIFKAISLFGGVQLYQIVIGIVRSKLIAMILGPSGMGIAGLYTSAILLVKNISSMGLGSSAVRDVSEAYSSDNHNKINIIINILRKLVWVTGLLGLAIVLFGSPFLSISTFGNYKYTIPFVLLSVTLLIDQLTVGQNVILQGTRKLSYLAKSSAIGSTIGLFVTIPIYYLWGVDGIVPALIIASCTSYLLASYFARKVHFEKVGISFKRAFKEGGMMIRMGIAMSLNGLLVSGASYLLRIFISHHGGTEAVGLFTAGYAIVTVYVGMIFSAIGTDYYPRLASVNHDNIRCRELINLEGEMGTFILSPCLIACILFMPMIIRILYTSEFDSASDYVLWACLGMMFKLFSWVIAFIFIAKGVMRLFLINESLGMIYNLTFSVLGFYYDGLRGLGIASTFCFVLYSIQVFSVAHIKYQYVPSLGFRKAFMSQLVLVLLALITVTIFEGYRVWAVGIITLLVSIAFSLYGLNKRMNLLEVVKRRIRNGEK